jgi:hypothetical protein
LHQFGLLHREAERLLAENVFARLSRSDDCVGMEVVRQADIDGVEICLGDHLPKIGVRDGIELGRAALNRLGHNIGNGYHLDGIGVRPIAPDMRIHNAAAADYTNLDGVHTAPPG